MPRLPDRATAEEARVAAGYSDPEWRRFIDITKNVARELRESDPGIRWASVAFNKKCQTTDLINTRLVKEGITAVGVDLVGWRMSKVIGNLKHAEVKASKYSNSNPPIAIDSASDTASPPLNPSNTRSFDPIRDI